MDAVDYMKIITDGPTSHAYFSVALDDYDLMERQLTWIIRGDVEDKKWWGKIKQVVGSQVEHVFEVQYFTIAFAIAVLRHRGSTNQIKWYPTSNDMQFAANIVNHGSNIKPLATKAHTDKSSYFRRGSSKEPLHQNDPLIKYLNDAATGKDGFKDLIDSIGKSLAEMKASKDAPITIDFRITLLTVLAQTVWYKGGWEAYLCKSGPIKFATNFNNADADEYYGEYLAPFDDNVFAPNAWGKVKN